MSQISIGLSRFSSSNVLHTFLDMASRSTSWCADLEGMTTRFPDHPFPVCKSDNQVSLNHPNLIHFLHTSTLSPSRIVSKAITSDLAYLLRTIVTPDSTQGNDKTYTSRAILLPHIIQATALSIGDDLITRHPYSRILTGTETQVPHRSRLSSAKASCPYACLLLPRVCLGRL